MHGKLPLLTEERKNLFSTVVSIQVCMYRGVRCPGVTPLAHAVTLSDPGYFSNDKNMPGSYSALLLCLAKSKQSTEQTFIHSQPKTRKDGLAAVKHDASTAAVEWQRGLLSRCAFAV